MCLPSAMTTGRSCLWNSGAEVRSSRYGRNLSPELRLPKLFNLRTDPYEFADITSNTYYDWFIYHDYIVYGAVEISTVKWAATFKEFPPVQKPNSFTIDDALKMLSSAATGR